MLGTTPNPTIYINEDMATLPKMSLGDEGMLTLRFRVVSASIDDDESGYEKKAYTLEYMIEDIKVKMASLQDAGDRVLNDPVKIHFSPSP